MITFKAFTKKADIAPKIGPKNIPPVGPNNSKRVKFWLDPIIWLIDIWKAANPKIVKIIENKILRFIF